MKRFVIAATIALLAGPALAALCGIPPLPPIGCKLGPCVCDQYGANCQWTFICGR